MTRNWLNCVTSDLISLLYNISLVSNFVITLYPFDEEIQIVRSDLYMKIKPTIEDPLHDCGKQV